MYKRQILKFVGGLHGYIRHELEMFPLSSLQEAWLTSKIEARKKALTLERKVSLISETSSTSSSSSSRSSSKKKKRKSKKKTSSKRKKHDDSRTCSHCGKKGHEKDKCWKLHPEKAPKSLHQRKQEKKVIDVCITSDEPNPTLILVNTEDREKERE